MNSRIILLLFFSFCVKIGQKEGGTQLKLVIEFAPGGMAMLKPMR